MRQLMLLLFVVLFVGIGFTLVAQDDDPEPVLQISVAGETCDLAFAEAEAEVDAEATPEIESTEAPEIEATEAPEIETTEEADVEATEAVETSASDAQVITLDAEGCADVLSQLRVAANGTLWIALTAPGEEEWQEFSSVEGDDAPLQFDRRGRYIGCSIPEEGAQVCQVSWEFEDVTYQIEIPVVVGDSFTAPATNTTTSNTAVSTQEPVTSTGGTGEWGACGSCSTCGASANVCVTSPEGACVADPTGCRPASSSSSDSSPSEPATTEEP
jgi:hypothetical protein